MTLDRPGFQAWLDRYVAAWKSYDPADIGALFSADCRVPLSPTRTSRLDRPGGDRRRLAGRPGRAAGTYDAKYEPLAIDGETPSSPTAGPTTSTRTARSATSTATSTCAASTMPASATDLHRVVDAERARVPQGSQRDEVACARPRPARSSSRRPAAPCPAPYSSSTTSRPFATPSPMRSSRTACAS